MPSTSKETRAGAAVRGRAHVPVDSLLWDAGQRGPDRQYCWLVCQLGRAKCEDEGRSRLPGQSWVDRTPSHMVWEEEEGEEWCAQQSFGGGGAILRVVELYNLVAR